MPNYSIKDLENLTGIQAHTIRIWEQRYKLLAPRRTPTNIRVYSDKDLRKLLSVNLLNNNGLKISKIANLTDDEIFGSVLRLTESNDINLENHIDTLKLIMVEMNESRFEKLFSHLVLQLGFEETILKVFVPFFTRINYLWQAESVTSAQIYFISALVKQKLYVALDGLEPADTSKRPFVFFLPKTEYVDTGLLIAHYVTRKRGYQTIYLGATLTAEEITEILQCYPTGYFMSVVSMAKIDITEYYRSFLAVCNEKQRLFVSGSQANLIRINEPRFIYFENLSGYKNYIENL
ncbi:MAG: MerR family transcriptional regulator [Bacteroidales bacterium]|jgi:DNA-binding transcriptional MerR regulator|nr:MerR family transcriptional regulator [Bacteroidales bacterium]